MDNYFWFYLFMVLLAGFFLRLIPRIIISKPTATDTYFHLYYADRIRKNRFRAPWSVPQASLNYGFQYPYFYHKILALFPRKILFNIEKFFSPLFDSLSGLIFALFSIFLSKTGILQLSDEKIILGTALFTLSPAFLRYGYGPRAYHLTPRVFGHFFYLAHVFSLFIWDYSDNIIPLIISIFSFAIAILSSNFTSQVLWFIAPFVIVFYSVHYSVVCFIALILAMFISNGRLYFLYEAHIKYTLFYKNYLQKVYLHNSIFVNSLSGYISRLRENVLKYSVRDWLYLIKTKNFINSFNSAAKWFIKERYFIHQLILYYHVFIFSLIYLFHSCLNYPCGDFARFSLAFILGGSFLYILTSFKKFLFIGENERYLEYVLAFGIFFFLYYFENYWIFAILLLLYFLFYLLNFYLLIKEEKSLSDSIVSLASAIGNLPDSESKVLYPLGWFFWPALYFYKGNVVTASALIVPNRHSVELYQLVYANFPYTDHRLEHLVKFFRVHYVLTSDFDTEYFFTKYPECEEYFRNHFKCIQHVGIFSIFEFINSKK